MIDKLCYQCGNICLCYNDICTIGKCNFDGNEFERIANSKCTIIELKYINPKIIDILSMIIEKTNIREIWIRYIETNQELLNAIPNGFTEIFIYSIFFIIKNYPQTVKKLYIQCNDVEALQYLPHSIEKLTIEEINIKNLVLETIPISVKTLTIYTSEYIDKANINLNSISQSVETLNIHISQPHGTYYNNIINNFNIECNIDLPNIKDIKIYGNTPNYFSFTSLYNLVNHCKNCTTFTLITEHYMAYGCGNLEPILNKFKLSCLLVPSIKTMHIVIATRRNRIRKYFKKYKAKHTNISVHLYLYKPDKLAGINKYREITNDYDIV